MSGGMITSIGSLRYFGVGIGDDTGVFALAILCDKMEEQVRGRQSGGGWCGARDVLLIVIVFRRVDVKVILLCELGEIARSVEVCCKI